MNDIENPDRTATTSWDDVAIILQASDVADLLGLSRSTVHRYVAAGTLQGTYLSKRRLVITKNAVQAMLGLPVSASGTNTSTTKSVDGGA